MPLKKIKNKFYRYINKKDFLLVISLIVPSFIIMQLKSISSYLDKRNDFAKTHKPLQITVNYISYGDYIKYTTNNDYKKNDDNQNIHHQGDIANNNNENSKRKQILSIKNFNKQKTNDSHSENQKEERKTNNKPKEKVVEQKEPEVGYFIVQANGKFYNPEDVRKTGKRQMLKLDDVVLTNEKKPSQTVIAGKIANKTIHKETIKESLVNLFYSLLKIKKKKNINAVVYDTRYDAYGKKIKTPKKSKTKKSKKTSKSNSVNQTTTVEEKINNTKNIKKITIQMVLDGRLQKNDVLNTLQDVDELTSYDKNTLLFIKDLEYNFERCWNKFSKKYINTEIFYKYRITYDKNRKIENITLIDKNIPMFHEQTAKNMLADIKETINECNSSQINIEKDNSYEFIEAIEITFKGMTEI